jgi:O-antigen/teichoic acid export membrane protein
VILSNKKNYHKSAVAMTAEKIIKMAAQLITLFFLAKYMGPHEFGNLMYLYAIASMFIFLNQLGLDTILVKYLIQNEGEKNDILNSAFKMRLVSSTSCVVIINIISLWLVRPEDRVLLFIISLYHFFLPASIYEWYFQSQGKGSNSAIGLICGHITGLFYRVMCVYFDFGLYYLAFSYILETVVVWGVYLFLLSSDNIEISFKGASNNIKSMLTDAFPIAISGAIIMLYMKMDQIMIGKMIGEADVGIYVSASRLSEAWYFIGITIVAAYFPRLLQIRMHESEIRYTNEVVKLGRLLVGISLFLGLITTFSAPWLIGILYDQSFIRASNVLSLTIWAIPFVYLGAISTKMYVANGDSKSILIRSIVGLCLNFFLNISLIPKVGIEGAAIATLVSQSISSYFLNIILIKKNNIFIVQTSCFTFLNIHNWINNDRK